jgi:pimeloyl-ACP methyl ester carboxylesterase
MMAETVHTLVANGLRQMLRDQRPSGATRGVVLCLHGFPDDHQCWTAITPHLVEAGYRVIAPDLRGFGHTDMATTVRDYDMFTGAMPDVIAILDALEIQQAHLVGHDFGAALSWLLAAQHSDRFKTLTAMSVGHQRAFLKARFTPAQMTRSRYILWHQFKGVCEWAYRRKDWAWFRHHWAGHPDIEAMITALARPGRLTAGLNWYRANIGLGRMLIEPQVGAFGQERVSIPTLGLVGSDDRYLDEAQMTGSADFIDATWRYERLEGLGHWIQCEAPERVARLLLEFWQEV